MRARVQEVYEILSDYHRNRDHLIPDSRTVIATNNYPVHVLLASIDYNEPHFRKLGHLIREWQLLWNVLRSDADFSCCGSMDFELNTLLPIFSNFTNSSRPHLDFQVRHLRQAAENNLHFLRSVVSETGLELIRAAQENMPNALLELGKSCPDQIRRYGYEALKQSILHSNLDCVQILKQTFAVPTEILIADSKHDHFLLLESATEYLEPKNRRCSLSPAMRKEIIIVLSHN